MAATVPLLSLPTLSLIYCPIPSLLSVPYSALYLRCAQQVFTLCHRFTKDRSPRQDQRYAIHDITSPPLLLILLLPFRSSKEAAETHFLFGFPFFLSFFSVSAVQENQHCAFVSMSIVLQHVFKIVFPLSPMDTHNKREGHTPSQRRVIIR